ncbi:protein FAR1-RELATED SEQUENCE 6 [Citrus sinensis]|uniref:Protein FAR1-RELATED SEQUENCE 6 n=1 Tax=Citrus sinensis TaxID=2711 RepID=A0ACB8JC89_CITSI|nr:protein FAR1-RELATED SEQUENCE 6 [Citrus sinensis]
MDEVSLNTEPVGDDEADDFEVVGDCAMTEYVGQTGIIQNPLPPAVGMEFETYDDVYYFYNCYAKEQGFGVGVSNTWYQKSREKYKGKLSCSNAGFKKKSEANRPRPETRTGCPAMIKFRLMETKRWRIIEVELEHNHLLSPRSGKFYKSHKHMGIGTKRTLLLDGAEEVQKIRLFRTLIIDAEGNERYDATLVSFIGVNHHGQSVLLGCGLLAENLQGYFEYEAIRAALHRAICHSLRPEEFETAWEDTIQRHGIRDHGWIQTLYEDRKSWAPVYLKETFLSGVFSFLQSEVSTSYFEGYLDKNTPLKEYLDKYDQALQANYQLEALADMDSRNSSCIQKPRCSYEFQLSKLYTNEMLRKFQMEVEAMYSCYSTKHVSADGPITYIVKEEFEVGSNEKDSRAFDVLYNASDLEVLCVCGLFNFRGYLCRHILCVLNQSGMEEIPSHYILSRWRKDVKRSYVLDHR